jgi:hypothetical protein
MLLLLGKGGAAPLQLRSMDMTDATLSIGSIFCVGAMHFSCLAFLFLLVAGDATWAAAGRLRFMIMLIREGEDEALLQLLLAEQDATLLLLLLLKFDRDSVHLLLSSRTPSTRSNIVCLLDSVRNDNLESLYLCWGSFEFSIATCAWVL